MSIAPRDELQEMAEGTEITEGTETSLHSIILPEGWARPRGYSNGVMATGRVVTIAGQIGWNPATSKFESEDFAAQTRQTLHNIVDVLLAADARPQDLVRLTWYVTDRDEYLAARKEIGAAYREIIGDHYPPMSVIFVSGLLEETAKVEIEATAVVPEHPV
jgi:enamine deaminase RidA (YjgF/YER057c/UK114 family)